MTVVLVLGVIGIPTIRWSLVNCRNRRRRTLEGSQGNPLYIRTMESDQSDDFALPPSHSGLVRRFRCVTKSHIRAITVGIVVLSFMFYSRITSGVLDAFRPVPLPRVHRLSADLSIDLSSSEYSTILVIALCGFVLYVLGIPLVALVILARGRKHLYEKKLLKTFGFLYLGYRRQVWWWEFLALLRKISIGLLAGVVRNTALAHFTVAILLLVSLGAQLVVRPFNNAILNGLETGSLVTLSISAVTVLFAIASRNTEGTIVGGDAPTISLWCVAVAVYLYAAISAVILIIGWFPLVTLPFRKYKRKRQNQVKRALGVITDERKRPLSPFHTAAEWQGQERDLTLTSCTLSLDTHEISPTNHATPTRHGSMELARLHRGQERKRPMSAEDASRVHLRRPRAASDLQSTILMRRVLFRLHQSEKG